MATDASWTELQNIQNRPLISPANEHGVFDDGKTKPPTRTPVKEWKPPGMRLWYHCLLILCLIILLALNEQFGRRALQSHPKLKHERKGFHQYWLLQQPRQSRISGWQCFCYYYLPTLVAFTLSQCFQALDADFKAIYPFMLLSRPGGATAKETLFTKYTLLNTHKALLERKWDLFLQTVVFVIPSMVYPLLATNWVIRKRVPHLLSNGKIAVEECEDFAKGHGCVNADIIITTSSAVVGFTSFLLVVHALLLGLFAWRCRQSRTGLVRSPHRPAELARLSRKTAFRAQWDKFPAWITMDTLQTAFARIKVALVEDCGNGEDSYLEFFDDGAGMIVPQHFSGNDTSSALAKSSFYRYMLTPWRAYQPLVLQPVVIFIATLWTFLWGTVIRGHIGDTGMTLEQKRLLCVFVALAFKLYLEPLERECRQKEPFRCSGIGDLATSSAPTGRTGKTSAFADTITTSPLLSVWSFLRLRLYDLAMAASLPWLIELWIIVVGTNPWSLSPTKEGLDNDILDAQTTIRPPLWLSILGVFVLVAITSYLWISLARLSSAVNYALPRHPDTIAARITYLYASESLMASPTRSVETGLQFCDGESDKKYAFGWFREGERLQLRLDVAENCIMVYNPLGVPPSVTGETD